MSNLKTLSIALNDKAFMSDIAPMKELVLTKITSFGDFVADKEGKVFYNDFNDNGEPYRNYGVSQYDNPFLKTKGLSAIDFGKLFITFGSQALNSPSGCNVISFISDYLRACLRRNKEQICHHNIGETALEIICEWSMPIIERDKTIDFDELAAKVTELEHGELVLKGRFLAKEIRRKDPNESLEDIAWTIFMRNLTTSSCDKPTLTDHRAHA